MYHEFPRIILIEGLNHLLKHLNEQTNIQYTLIISIPFVSSYILVIRQGVNLARKKCTYTE